MIEKHVKQERMGGSDSHWYQVCKTCSDREDYDVYWPCFEAEDWEERNARAHEVQAMIGGHVIDGEHYSDTGVTLRLAGYKRPLNWDDMGSSSKDLWEERMMRDLEKRQAVE